MARVTINLMGFDVVVKELEAMGKNSEGAFEAAVRAGSSVFAEKVRKNLAANIESTKSASPRNGKRKKKRITSKGDLMESFGISPASRDRNGNWSAGIGFPTKKGQENGYDRKMVPNVLKARAMEKGVEGRLKARPFASKARWAAESKAMEKAGNILLEKLTNEKG